MFIKNDYVRSVSSAALASLLTLAAQANATCPENTNSWNVKGEIYNNAIAPGTTLGTMHLILGKDNKLKCGIMGNGGGGPDGTLNFVHTLVCDDIVTTGINNETIHSQLTLNTSGSGNFQACDPNIPQAGVYGTFREISLPIAGRGKFQGVAGGEIMIDGTINCQFTIDMEFKGYICLPSH